MNDDIMNKQEVPKKLTKKEKKNQKKQQKIAEQQPEAVPLNMLKKSTSFSKLIRDISHHSSSYLKEQYKDEEISILSRLSHNKDAIAQQKIANLNSREIIKQEMDTLQNVFFEDIQVIEEVGDDFDPGDSSAQQESFGKIQIRIFPSTEQQKNFCYVDLLVSYQAGYPGVPPLLSILSTSKGIRQEYYKEIQNLMENKARECAKEQIESIFDIICEVQEPLSLINQETSSFQVFEAKTEEKEQNKQSLAPKKEEEKSEDRVPGYSQNSTPSLSKQTSEMAEYQKARQSQAQLEFQQILAGAQWRKNIYQMDSNGFGSSKAFEQKGQFNFNIQTKQQSVVEDESHINWQPILNTLINQSRYKVDFEELEKIGEGGAGRVFKARHKIDRNIYAIKKVKLYKNNEKENDRIIREVTVISRLQNLYIVRYFQAWVEVLSDEKELAQLGFSGSEDGSEEDSESDDSDEDEKRKLSSVISSDGNKRHQVKGKSGKGTFKWSKNRKQKKLEYTMDSDGQEEEEDDDEVEDDSLVKEAGGLRTGFIVGGEQSHHKHSKKSNPKPKKQTISQRKSSITLKQNPFLHFASNHESSSKSQRHNSSSEEEEEEDEPEKEQVSEYSYYDEEDDSKEIQKQELVAPVIQEKQLSQKAVSERANIQVKEENKASSQDFYDAVSKEDDATSEEFKSSSSRLVEKNRDYFVGKKNNQIEVISDSSSSSDQAKLKEKGQKSLSKQSSNSKKQIQQTRILYIQMEFCEGDTLRNFIDANPGKSKEDQKWKIFAQIVEALNYLHNQGGLIHRDLKPMNVFLDKSLTVKLGDFGLAVHHHHHQHGNPQPLKPLPKQEISSLYQQTQMHKAPAHSLLAKQPVTSSNGSKMFSKDQHSVGIGTLAYMAPEQNKGKGKYSFQVDMYSLGLIFFEMWCGFSTFIERDKAMNQLKQRGVIDAQYEKIIPANAAKVILWLVRDDPSERPSTIALLQSELLPPRIEDEVFRKFILQIGNHKTIESIKLMNFLLKRNTPRNIDLTYEFQNIKSIQSQTKGTSNMLQQEKAAQKAGQLINNGLNKQQINLKESIIRSKITKFLKDIFVLHGAVDIDIPVMAPAQDSFTLFLSLRQQMPGQERKCSSDGTHSLEVDLKTAESVISYIEMDLHAGNTLKTERIPSKLVIQQLEKSENVRQRVVFLNTQKVEMRQKLLDSTGISLVLSETLQENFARSLTRIKLPGSLLRRYHIGKVYNTNDGFEGSFDLVSPGQQSVHYTNGDELIFEAEVIKVCEEVAQKLSSEMGKQWYIRINSSEVIDGILSECNVKLAHRYKILQILAQLDNKSWTQVKKDLQDATFPEFHVPTSTALVLPNLQNQHSSGHGISSALLERMGELLKIKGSIAIVEEKVKGMKGLKQIDRFKKVIEYFKILRKYFQNFGLTQIDSGDLQGGTFIFDFGLILEDQEKYHAGMFFKLQLIKVSQQQTLQLKVAKPAMGAEDLSSKNKNKHKGLPTSAFYALGGQSSFHKESMHTQESGKLSVSDMNANSHKKKDKKKLGLLDPSDQTSNPTNFYLSSYLINNQWSQVILETLALGGRYDNMAAHFQLVKDDKSVPIVVGVRFFFDKISQILSQKEQSISLVDVLVISIGDMTQEKMILLNELWRLNIRAEANLSSDPASEDILKYCKANNIRLLITFKKAVYQSLGKVKVRDIWRKTEADETRENLVACIKSRLSVY